MKLPNPLIFHFSFQTHRSVTKPQANNLFRYFHASPLTLHLKKNTSPQPVVFVIILFITHYIGCLKTRRSFLQLIWLMGVWLVRNEHNNELFNNIQTPIIELMDKVKYNFYWWLKANNTTFVYGSQRWWSDPLLCLSID